MSDTLILCLDAALELGPTDRAAYLDEACAGDPDLRARIDGLLAAHGQAGAFMRRPVASEITVTHEPMAERPGTVIGPYKLMEQVGEGGMGLVFVAEQTQPVRRKVALKVIKPGMDTRQVVARFEAERQALALMDHPNIAKVLDAGTTETGRPYFVMELVRGVPITEYCDAVKLPPRQRLELFVQVCQAVQHAHQKGVIHRDLKPSNILVSPHDGVPVVKVIDFGVAKALGQQLTEKTIYTGLAQMLGTPLYMSPEQAEVNQLDVDTRSDVYSLGVLLYELLTGTTPLDRQRLKTAAFEEIRRIIREEEPPRPSARLTTLGEALRRVSAERGLDLARLSRFVRGELDWIVMRCLEKDRARRYETVAGLAKDVRRFLADEPVEARPASLWYRARKAYRRNRIPLLVGTGFALLILVGLGLVTWKWQAERAARGDADAARKDAEDRTREVLDGAERMNAANSAVDLGDMYVNFYRWADADAEYTKATELRKDHSSVWMRRSRFYAQLGLWDLAAADAKQALTLHEPGSPHDWWHNALLLLESGDVPAYQQLCLRMRDRFGAATDLFELGGLVVVWGLSPHAPPGYADVIRLCEERTAAGDPGERGVRPYFLGMGYYRTGRFEDAVRNLRESLTDTEWRWRPINYPVLATALHRDGQPEAARRELANARATLDRWAQDVFDVQNRFVPVQHWRDWLGMQRWYREAHRIIEGSDPPDDPRLRVVRGRALAALGRTEPAAREYAAALRLAPESYPIRLETFRFHAAEKRWQEAEAELAVLKTIRPNDPDVPVAAFRAFAASGHASNAAKEHALAVRLRPEDTKLLLERFRFHSERGEREAAESAYAEATGYRANDVPFRVKLGDALAGLKQWAKARDEYARVLEVGLFGDGEANRTAWLRLGLLQLYFDDVDGYRRTCKVLVERFGSDPDWRTCTALVRLCTIHPDPGVEPDRLARLFQTAQKGDEPGRGAHAQAVIALRAGKADVDVAALRAALNRYQWNVHRIGLARVLHAQGKWFDARGLMNQVGVESRRVDPAAGSAENWDFALETQLWYRQADAVIQTGPWRAAGELARQKKWSEAIRALDSLLKPEDKSPQDWGMRANCYSELGRWREAYADSTRANALGPDFLPGAIMHALACLRAGENEAYLGVCRHALERHAKATNSAVLNNVAWLCVLDASAGREAAEALALLDHSSKSAPINNHAHTRACLLYRVGHLEEARDEFDKLVARPGYAATAYDWLFMSMTCQRLGQTAKAKDCLRRAVDWMDSNRDLGWGKRAELQTFRAEAEGLLGEKK